jgi:hypothetical protein
MGGFTFDPKEGTLVLQTRRESSLCGDDTGTYTVRIGGIAMDAELVRDTCEMRTKLFAKQFGTYGFRSFLGDPKGALFTALQNARKLP